ncbi:MAG: hypothetical protein GKR77_07930 [Legionellales bacterium]|nr:hypothetical protein [Legionellales bacterium]
MVSTTAMLQQRLGSNSPSNNVEVRAGAEVQEASNNRSNNRKQQQIGEALKNLLGESADLSLNI